MKGFAQPAKRTKSFSGGDFGGYCPAAQGDLGRWTSSAAGVHSFTPNKPGFSLRKSWTKQPAQFEKLPEKVFAIDLHPGEETHWIQLNCMKEDHAEKELYPFSYCIDHFPFVPGIRQKRYQEQRTRSTTSHSFFAKLVETPIITWWVEDLSARMEAFIMT